MFRLMQGASALTLAAALALAPVGAVAQTGTGTTTETLPETGTTPGEPLPPTAGTDPLLPEDDAETDMAADEAMPEPVEGTIQMQDSDTVLASDLLGARIYNAADEAVGSIDDLIVSTDGSVEGVVIGVGGFLGIGKKPVAVQMSQISVQPDASGNPRLLLDATRDSLQAAPAFVTASEQSRLQEIEDVQPTQGVTGTEGGLGTGAAPPALD